MSKVKGDEPRPCLLLLFSPAESAPPPASPRRQGRISRSKAARSAAAGRATLAKYGLAHYRRIQALATAAHRSKPKPPRTPRTYARLSPVGYATLKAISTATGLSQSAILREAWEAQLRQWAERNPPKE